MLKIKVLEGKGENGYSGGTWEWRLMADAEVITCDGGYESKEHAREAGTDYACRTKEVFSDFLCQADFVITA